MSFDQSQWFQRTVAGDQYVHALAAMYRNGWRIYDPSFALARDFDMEERVLRDTDVAAALQHRWLSIAGLRWTVSPADEADERSKALAALCVKLLGHLDGFTESRMNLARAHLSGARFAERVRGVVTAGYGDGKPRQWVVTKRLSDMSKHRFRWARSRENMTDPTAPIVTRLETFSLARGDWRPVPDDAPLVQHRIGDSEERMGYGRADLDALYFWVGAKARLFEERMAAIERFGRGQVVLTLAHADASTPGITNEELVRRAQENVDKARARHAFIVQNGDKVEVLQPTMTGHEMMASFYKEMKDALWQFILASINPMGGGGDKGSYAKAETEAESRQTIIDVHGELLEETLTRDVLVPMLRDNWPNIVALGLDTPDHPRFNVIRGRKQDPKAVADRVEVLLRSGIALKAEEVYEGVGFTKPGPDDEVITAPQPVSPFGGAFPGSGPEPRDDEPRAAVGQGANPERGE